MDKEIAVIGKYYRNFRHFILHVPEEFRHMFVFINGEEKLAGMAFIDSHELMDAWILDDIKEIREGLIMGTR